MASDKKTLLTLYFALIGLFFFLLLSMISIRKAIASDNPACRILVQRSLANFGIQAQFDGLDFAIASLGIKQDSSAIELVVQVADQLVACIVIHALDQTKAKIYGFHVQAEQQGKGIGKKLLQTALLESERLGFSHIQVDTCERMQVAVKLYESLGFLRIEDPLPDSGADRSYRFSFSEK